MKMEVQFLTKSKKMWYLILILLVAFCNKNAPNADKTDSPEVSISLGRIKGSIMKTRLGKEVYAFRGLRYGKAPTGNLRFKPAVPATAWKGLFDAVKEGPACFGKGKIPSSDDCLRLNVYTTTLEETDEKYPVMVFIHPGGFYTYSGQSNYFGPQYLLDEDIVLVTINYRLGTIGFTATGDEIAPGNLGLKDQVEALRWVQNNIAPFNGDPSCVTIVGYSAGSWSTALHMLSPMSQGLFHRVVSMSGSPMQPDGLRYHQKSLAKKQAKILGCPSNDIKEMIECFQEVPIETMAQSRKKFFQKNNNPNRYWMPVVEPNLPEVEHFIVDQPINLIRNGEFNKVPFLAGSTLHEFAFKLIRKNQTVMKLYRAAVELARSGNHSMFNEFNQHWEKIAPIVLMYEHNTTLSSQRSQDLRTLYFEDEPITYENWRNLAMMYADVLATFPMRRLVDLISEYSDQPVYYYRFCYRGRYSYRNWKSKKPFGVSHDDDLQYLFFMKQYFPLLPRNATESLTIKRMTAMWASFAKTGDPIPKDNPLFKDTIWNPYDKNKKAYMEINNTLTLKSAVDSYREGQMKALEQIFPLPPVTEQDDKESTEKEGDKKDDDDKKKEEGEQDKKEDEDNEKKEEDNKDDEDTEKKEEDNKDDEDTEKKEEDNKNDEDTEKKEEDNKDDEDAEKKEEDKKEDEGTEKKEEDKKDNEDTEKKEEDNKNDEDTEKKEEDNKDDEDAEKKEEDKKEDEDAEKKEEDKKEDEDTEKKEEDKKEDGDAEKKEEDKKEDEDAEKKEENKKEDEDAEKKEEDKKEDDQEKKGDENDGDKTTDETSGKDEDKKEDEA